MLCLLLPIKSLYWQIKMKILEFFHIWIVRSSWTSFPQSRRFSRICLMTISECCCKKKQVQTTLAVDISNRLNIGIIQNGKLRTQCSLTFKRMHISAKQMIRKARAHTLCIEKSEPKYDLNWNCIAKCNWSQERQKLCIPNGLAKSFSSISH